MKVSFRVSPAVTAVGFLSVLAFHSHRASADRFYLTEDRLIEGILVREDTSTVTFRLEGAGLWTLSRHSLYRVDRESPGQYWLRIGERHARRNRLNRAREAFLKALKSPDTKHQAFRRLKDLDLLDKSITPDPEELVRNPNRKKLTVEKNQSRTLVPSAKNELPAPRQVSTTLSSTGSGGEPADRRSPSMENGSGTSAAVEKKAKVEKKKKVRRTTRPGRPSSRLSELIGKYASRYGVDPLLVKAIITVESRWNPRAISKSGAKGLMQLMPETAAAYGVKDSYDPEQNIRAGVRYLSHLLKQFEDLDWRMRFEQTIAAYHTGPSRIREVGDYRRIPKAVRYTEKVMSVYRRLVEQKNAEFAFLNEGTTR